MTVRRVLIGVAGALGVVLVLSSAVRSVVLPPPFPARVAGVAFLAARALALRQARRAKLRRREEL